MILSSIPIVEASFRSKSVVPSGIFSVWHVAQFLGSGDIPLSAEWQVKHVVCPIGEVLKVPFFNQNASPKVAGGLVTYSSADSPCGL